MLKLTNAHTYKYQPPPGLILDLAATRCFSNSSEGPDAIARLLTRSETSLSARPNAFAGESPRMSGS